MRVLLLGDVGVPGYHVGDEAMFTANLDWWRARGAEVVGLSVRPAQTASVHGIQCLAQADWTRIAYEKFDVLHMSGGGNIGSLFESSTRMRCGIVCAAAKAGARCVVTGQTLGPGGNIGGLSAARYVGVRDLEHSAAFAAKQGVSARPCVDDSLFLTAAEPPEDPPNEVLGFSLHHHAPGWISSDKLRQKAEAVAATSPAPLAWFIPHFPTDRPLGDAMAKANPRVQVHMAGLLDRYVKSLTGRCSMYVTTRYHGAIFALGEGVPCVAFYQDRYTQIKLEGAFDVLNVSRCSHSIEELSPDLIRHYWARRCYLAEQVGDALPAARDWYAQERELVAKAVSNGKSVAECRP